VVSDESASYTVFTNDGKKHDASVLARDPLQDIAIVKIDPPAGGLPVVRLGNSDSVRLGQTAVAIGNAFGEFRNTVSVGIVSGLARDIDAGGGGIVEHLEGLIQTDAAINPGNSGGPLLNLRGEVIGMNTAVAAGAENIGFSIPINNIRRDIDSVQRSGRIIIPFLGVRYLLIDGVVAEAENLPVQYGAILRGSGESSAIVPDSPAAAAGLMAEDIVLAVNGMPVTRSLSATIQQYAVGDTVALTVLRAGRELQIPVTLAEREF
jgi:S1-C subfamily serine protease